MILAMKPGKAVSPRKLVRAESFADEAGLVVARLREALTGLFASLQRPVRGGVDLQKQLGLASTVAWKLHAFVEATGPLEGVELLPGKQGMQRLYELARERGLGDRLIEAVGSAYEEYQRFVDDHAGTRAGFLSMVSSAGPGEGSSADLDARRDAFRAMSHIYGVQRAVSIACCIIHPGTVSGRHDFVYVCGSIGLRVMRRVEKLCIGRHEQQRDKAEDGSAHILPLESTDTMGGVPLLVEHCSHPLPVFNSQRDPSGNFVEHYISDPPLGRLGECTYFLGERVRNVIAQGERLKLSENVMFPTETMLLDVLLAPGVIDPAVHPDTGVFGNAISSLRLQQRPVDRLNIRAETAQMGEGVGALRTTLAPQYTGLLESVCRKMSWNAEAFNAYRCRLDFPVLHSLLSIRFPGTGTDGG